MIFFKLMSILYYSYFKASTDITKYYYIILSTCTIQNLKNNIRCTTRFFFLRNIFKNNLTLVWNFSKSSLRSKTILDTEMEFQKKFWRVRNIRPVCDPPWVSTLLYSRNQFSWDQSEEECLPSQRTKDQELV